MSVAGSAATIASAALGAMSATWRARTTGEENINRLRETGDPYVYALWHGRMLLPIWRHRGEGAATMASQSKDGEIIARWLSRNGYRVVRGSSTRGGARALLELKALMREGRPAALTVDGPKGPPRIVQEGIVTLARSVDAWIIPVSASASRPRFLKSWDRYLVPKLFSKTVVVYGEPFRVPAAVADAPTRIKSALDRVTAEADRLLGVTPPAPW